MSEKIADWLIGQKAISSDERELYAYAVHCLFSDNQSSLGFANLF